MTKEKKRKELMDKKAGGAVVEEESKEMKELKDPLERKLASIIKKKPAASGTSTNNANK